MVSPAFNLPLGSCVFVVQSTKIETQREVPPLGLTLRQLLCRAFRSVLLITNVPS